MSRMITIEDIIAAYFAARPNKRRSPDQVEFELHWEAKCVQLWQDVCNRCVCPTAYTFVASNPRPREVFASDMATRILHHYIDMRLRRFLESRMSDHTFNNRVGMGQSACQNAVITDIYEVSHGFTEDCWIVKADMSGCFPNIRQDTAYAQLREVIEADYKGGDKDELLYMLQVCVYSYPTHHCFRKSSMDKWKAIPKEKSLFSKPDGVGAAIGHLIWQNAVNYYFHEIDEWVLSLGVKYERFVDDMYFIIDDKRWLAVLMPELRERLKAMGATLHPHKFYYQHYTKGVECLGLHIKMGRIYPNSRVVHRGMTKATTFNKCIRAGKVSTLLSSLNSYLGVCKNACGFNQAKKIVASLNRKWFDYVTFNTSRCCLVALPEYKFNNLVISKYHLK